MAEELRQALADLVRLTDHNPEAKALLEGITLGARIAKAEQAKDAPRDAE